MSADSFHNISCLFVEQIKNKISAFFLKSLLNSKNLSKNPFQEASSSFHVDACDS